MNTTNWRKRTSLGVVAAVIVLAVAYGFMPQPVRVEVESATRERLQVVIEEEGKTRVRERYVVTAPLAGYALRVTWNVGDAVKQGDLLLTLEPLRSDVLDPRRRAEAEARVAAAAASLDVARSQARAASEQAAFTQAEYERVRSLHAAGSATKQMLDRAVTEARRTEADRTAADHAVEVARYQESAARTALRFAGAEDRTTDADCIHLPAPIDGSVLAVHHESAGVVAPGQPLLELGDPRALEVVVDVLSSDAVQIMPGMSVEFERWGGPPLKGRVRTVEPVARTRISALGVEEQHVAVVADLIGGEAVRLGDGYRVVARFIVWDEEDVLQVPSSALFRTGQGWALFVAEGGRARRRDVEVGVRSGLRTEITGGLREGAHIIAHPDDAIEDGTRIKPWE